MPVVVIAEKTGLCGHPLTGRQRLWCSTDCSKAAAREARLNSHFNITAIEYDLILAAQDGHCATCPAKPKPEKHLAVDHDHRTGFVRGLLCFMCNKRFLGSRSDDVIARIHEYVTDPPARRVIGNRVAPGRPKKKRKSRRRIR